MNTVVKQPNGKYCVLNYRGDLLYYNCTEQEVINKHIEEATKKLKEEIRNAESSGVIIECMLLDEKYRRGRRFISDKQLEEMGFDKPYDELVKYIPREPLDQQYSSCNFATYGKCPSCGKTVQDGIGFKHEKCDCGQILRWK